MDKPVTKRRPRVGIMVGNFHTDHPIHLVYTVWKLLQEKDVDAQFYLGTESSSFMSKFSMRENKFDYQYASLYGFSHFDDLDVLIISAGTLFIYQQNIDMKKFLDELPNIPVVLLENDIQQTNHGCYIITDNYGAMRKLTEHLVTDHHLTKLGFISGPVNNCDSDNRMKAYLDVMQEHGLPVTDKMIQRGDYSEHVAPQINQLLDDNPGLEAIVCANDEMALSAYEVCKERGLTIGKDITITGFDDILLAEYMEPPLTTCRQDYTVIARRAVDRAMDILNGVPVYSEVVPSPVIYRESCGCVTTTKLSEAEIRSKERRTLIDNIWQRHSEQSQPWIGSLLFRESLNDALSYESFFDNLAINLSQLGCPASYVCLMERPAKLQLGEILTMPSQIYLAMRQHGNTWESYDFNKSPIFPKDQPEYARYYIQNGTYVTFLLFYEEYLYGTFNVQIDPKQIPFYYMLSLEIGSALRFLQISWSHKAAQKALKEKNDLLDFMASHDDLTGLYNRAGIIQKVIDELFLIDDSDVVVAMADLDHLKEINDAFGHPEGDSAIRKAAEILRKNFGEEYPLGRIGGDEYMGMFRIASPEDIERCLQSIARDCEEYNASSGKPYLLHISIGTALVPMGSPFEFFNIYHDADRNLYEAKKTREPTALRLPRKPKEADA